MKTQIFADNVAIGLSSLCIVHCLVLPLLVAALPYVAGLALLSNEAVHTWLLAAVLPISLLAVLAGFKQHGSKGVLLLVGVGCSCLILPLLVSPVSALVEVPLTVLGSVLIATGHYRNLKRKCSAPECT